MGSNLGKRTVVSLLAIAAVAGAQKTEAPETINVCDLLRNPVKYNGKVVDIRGVYFPGGHGLYLQGDNCEGVLVTKGYKWSSLVYLPLSAATYSRNGDVLSEEKRLDDEKVRRALDETAAMMASEARKGNGAELSRFIVTYRGLLETLDNFDREVGRAPDGRWVANGFGPGASAPAQLFINSVKSVVAEFRSGNQATVK